MNVRKLKVVWQTPAIVSGLFLCAGLSVSGTAHATEGEEDAAETAAARTLAIDGVKLAQADRCSEAIDKLDRAEKLKHSPIVLRHLGECQVKVGRWVEGSESLRKLLREPLPEGASPAVSEAYESAQTTLREIKPRIPTMKILVGAPADTDLTVKVDGKTVADSVVGVALPTDPGQHTIEATAPGFLKAKSTVDVTPGGAATVALELERDPAALAPKPAPQPAQPSSQASSAFRAVAPEALSNGSHTGRVVGYVSYGVAAVGLGAGIIFGVSAMNDEKALNTACPNQVCPPERQDDLEFAKTKGIISTIGFGVAGAGVALGTVLLLTSGSSSKTGSKDKHRHTASMKLLRPRAALGLGKVSFAADF